MLDVTRTHEGFTPVAVSDRAHVSIGYGTCTASLAKNERLPKRVTRRQAEILMRKEFAKIATMYERKGLFPAWATLRQKHTFYALTYWAGFGKVTRSREFRLYKNGNIQGCYDMLTEKWFKQPLNKKERIGFRKRQNDTAVGLL